MSSNDDFVHIFTRPEAGPSSGGRSVSQEYFNNSKGERVFTEGLVIDAMRRKHPKHHITVTPGYLCDLIAFADSSKDVTYLPYGDSNQALSERQFIPPARRYNDENGGNFVERVVFGCYDYTFEGNQFLVYIVEGGDGALQKTRYNYVLVEDLTMADKASAQKKADDLIAAASKWMQELHGEVLVFDNGFWQKSKELWDNIQKSNWEDVILEKGKKNAIIEDVVGFFNAEERYSEFGVPWKAGVALF